MRDADLWDMSDAELEAAFKEAQASAQSPDTDLEQAPELEEFTESDPSMEDADEEVEFEDGPEQSEDEDENLELEDSGHDASD